MLASTLPARAVLIRVQGDVDENTILPSTSASNPVAPITVHFPSLFYIFVALLKHGMRGGSGLQWGGRRTGRGRCCQLQRGGGAIAGPRRWDKVKGRDRRGSGEEEGAAAGTCTPVQGGQTMRRISAAAGAKSSDSARRTTATARACTPARRPWSAWWTSAAVEACMMARGGWRTRRTGAAATRDARACGG